MGTLGRSLKIDPTPTMASSSNPSIAYFARRDLMGLENGSVATLWELPDARRIVARQQADGSWRYPGVNNSVRSRENYDQLETFRQTGLLVEKFGCTRDHPAVACAANHLFSFQTSEGDFRGIYNNQYATTYVGAIMELLIKAGYADDLRIANGFRWLLTMRQNDGGWAIPLRTTGIPFSGFFDQGARADPVVPDRSKPSSHLVTGMVLRAFAAHPGWRGSAEVHRAAAFLAARLYQRDSYGDRRAVAYWERVSFPFWFTDVVSAFDSLSRLGFDAETPRLKAALKRVRELQRKDGTFAFKLLKGKDRDLRWWICLAVCRSFKRWRQASASS